MAKKVIFSTNLQDFRPVIWYGEPIFSKYRQLQSIIKEGIGEKYANFFSEPAINKESIEDNGKASWLSEHISKGKPFSALKGQELENAKAHLQQILKKLEDFSKELQSQDNANQKELGELLSLAVEVPGLDYIFIENDKITIVLWGFTSDKAEKQNFNINRVVTAPVVVPPPPPPVKKEPVQEIKTQEITPTPPPIPPPPEKEKKKMSAWLWLLIGALIMFLILLLLWLFVLRDNNSTAKLPDNGVLPPTDSETGFDPDDPAKKKIFTDKVNLVLQTDANLLAYANSLNEKYSNDLEVVYYDTLINLMQIKTPENEWKRWADTLKTHKEVRLTFTESVFARELTPTDPDFNDAQKNWYFEQVKVYDAWETTKGDPELIVAIIDNGFDITHIEFKDKVVKSWNVYEQSDKLYPINIEGGEHGTHVAATAIGLMNNNSGLCGIAPNCKFMPIQVADKNGALSSLSIVSGILYAINQGASVVNISLGTYFDEPVLKLPEETQEQYANTLYPDEAIFWDEIYQFGNENNVIIIQAAGNQNIATGIDPFSRSNKSITVAATEQANTKAEFSNWGDLSTVSAPGTSIYSATPNDTYNFLQGTSMASPIVTGGVALIKSAHPDWTNEQIIQALVNTAIPVQSDRYIGPMIQLDKAINYGGSDSTLVIPDDAKDLSFAKGIWKSDNDLISTIDKKPIELFFDIKGDGTGELTLVEADGTKCIAELVTTFEKGELILVQQEEAQCEGVNKTYREYQFVCVKGKNNQADCTAKEKNGSGEFLDFNLEKVK